MLFKLAPSWNKFGQYLCQGKNFLLYTEDFNAVKLGVNIKSNFYLSFGRFENCIIFPEDQPFALQPRVRLVDRYSGQN